MKRFMLFILIIVFISISFSVNADQLNDELTNLIDNYPKNANFLNVPDRVSQQINDLLIEYEIGIVAPTIMQNRYIDLMKQKFGNSMDNDTFMCKCAAQVKGYYLKATYDVRYVNWNNKGHFVLIEPNTYKEICSVNVKASGGVTNSFGYNALSKKGIKELYRQLKKVKPEIIQSK